MAIGEGEYFFFKSIIKDCNIIFDVGCRYDTFYVEMTEGKHFYLFEPNPYFYDLCFKKLSVIKLKNTVELENFGLGNTTEEKTYWQHTQSFIDRKDVPNYYGMPTLPLHIMRFTEYINKNNINKIDFLKLDVEGLEPDILLDNPEFIKTSVENIQFEWGSTWNCRQDGVTIYDIFRLFQDDFRFYFLYNSDHPISKKIKSMIYPIEYDEEWDELNEHVKNNYGFEIAMIKRR